MIINQIDKPKKKRGRKPGQMSTSWKIPHCWGCGKIIFAGDTYGTKKNGKPLNECKQCAKDRQFAKIREYKPLNELKEERKTLLHRISLLDKLIKEKGDNHGNNRIQRI